MSRELKGIFEGNKWTIKKKGKVRSTVTSISKYKITAIMTLGSYLQILQAWCFIPKKDIDRDRVTQTGTERRWGEKQTKPTKQNETKQPKIIIIIMKEREKDFWSLCCTIFLSCIIAFIGCYPLRVSGYFKGKAEPKFLYLPLVTAAMLRKQAHHMLRAFPELTCLFLFK